MPSDIVSHTLCRLSVLTVLIGGACATDQTAPADKYVGAVQIAPVSGSPPGISIGVGVQLTLQATVVDNAGHSVSPQPQVVFTTATDQVAAVTAIGVLTGRSPGSTTLRAEVVGPSAYRPASVPVTVIQIAGSAP